MAGERNDEFAVDLVTLAIRLSSVSLAWSLLVGVVSVVAGLSAHSVALIGFGLESFIDGSASAMLVWRFRIQHADPARAERLERTAERAVAITLLMVAVFLVTESVRALVAHTHTQVIGIGVALTLGSLLVLPTLAVIKLRVARQLPSAALRGDGVLTVAGSALAGTVLLAIGMEKAFGWWWCDSASALIIAAALGWDARQTLTQLTS